MLAAKLRRAKRRSKIGLNLRRKLHQILLRRTDPDQRLLIYGEVLSCHHLSQFKDTPIRLNLI